MVDKVFMVWNRRGLCIRRDLCSKWKIPFRFNYLRKFALHSVKEIPLDTNFMYDGKV